jgi:carbamoyltransferase
MQIIGISCFYHDSAAALIVNGEIKAAVQEERFSRKKNDADFPIKSIEYCLLEGQIEAKDLDAIVFFEKPFLKFERIIESFIDKAPLGLFSFSKNMPKWIKQKLFMKREIIQKFDENYPNIDWSKTQLLFSKHHLSHAASAFFVSPFEEAAILTIDGVGEQATATISKGIGNSIETIKELNYPHSLGLFYSAFTAFLGFEINNGEYKVMGLAPYASRNREEVEELVQILKNNLILISETGSIRLNTSYFQFNNSKSMLKTKKVEQLLNMSAISDTSSFSTAHLNLAQAIQKITEEVLLKMVQYTKHLYPSENLCIAGGLALNCVANGKIKESSVFKNIFIQPAAGDAGGSLGAALEAYYLHFKKQRNVSENTMKNALLGPSFSESEILKVLTKTNSAFDKVTTEQKIALATEYLLEGKTIGWFQGRMEFGPRALGNRSIIANPLLSETQSTLNLKVKKRESFRPFAPILLEEEFELYFGQKYASPYMLFAHKIKESFRKPFNLNSNLIESINQTRSPFPAVTHVDFSSRIQTVNKDSNPELFQLLVNFKSKTGFGILVNTSFNIKDEPIVCTPMDAINCFNNTEIDVLIMNNFIFRKN